MRITDSGSLAAVGFNISHITLLTDNCSIAQWFASQQNIYLTSRKYYLRKIIIFEVMMLWPRSDNSDRNIQQMLGTKPEEHHPARDLTPHYISVFSIFIWTLCCALNYSVASQYVMSIHFCLSWSKIQTKWSLAVGISTNKFPII